MKMKHANRVVIALLLFWAYGAAARAADLFRNGRSNYRIVLSAKASTTEKTAARELQSYLWKIGHVQLPIVAASGHEGTRRIFVGYHPGMAPALSASQPADDDDGFTYKTVGDDLYIYGGRNRGTMYGVFAFLENELGVRWYTKDVTRIPQRRHYVLPSLNHTEKPVVKYRYVQFHKFNTDSAVYAHNKMNMVWDAMPTQYGKLHNYWGVHTSEWLVPTKEYYNTHPEYFSYRQGRRIPNSQLCLSNPEVLRLVIANLKTKINPVIDYWCYDVSQNDNQLFCECDDCKKLEARYGGHAGIWVWFVNQVAAALPHIKVGTFAYQYTRHAPKNIVPRENVVIRLCSVECCFAHPIETCPENRAFMQDYSDWMKLTRNIFVWDYVVNFDQYLPPFPNFAVLKPNIQTFVKHNAMAVLELGQYTSGDGEFSEMRAWVISKLLWNPELDTDSLVRDFIYGYYGKAAPSIERYHRLVQQLVKPDTHIGCYIKGTNKIFTDSFIAAAEKHIAAAYRQSENAEIRRRVKMVELQLLYLQFARDRIKALSDGTYPRLLKIIQEERPHINEGITAEEFIQKNGYI